MAQIDIQKKSGNSWLWWVLGLIVLALLAWWLISAMNDNDRTGLSDGAVATPPAVVPSVTDSADLTGYTVITNLNVLTSADSARVLVGRRVALTSAPVASVASDKGFWIGDTGAAGQRLFVVRGNQNASYTAPNGAVDAGERVNIYGTVQAMPANLTQQTTEWNLKSTDKSALSEQPVYVMADSVRIASQ